MPLNVTTSSLLNPTTPYGPGIGNAARAVRSWRLNGAEDLARGLEALQNRVDSIDKTNRTASPTVSEIVVTDDSGQVIAALGDLIYAGVPYTNYFSEIHAGDPLMTRDPAQAVFNANADGSVTIGKNGYLDILDPYSSDAAWIGTQFDTLAVTGAANNGSGLIRLTVTGHTLSTGDVVRVLNVGGVPNATGDRTVTSIDANHVDLQNTVFVGTYTSGGTVSRLLHVSGVANNGSGLIRITTAVAHGYESGDRVHLQNCGAANGEWTITVIDTTHFDLAGSTYTSGSNGQCLRYFAGGLFQTIAIGPSFSNYKLRAFADGSLRIKNSEIDLTDGSSTLVISPTGPTISFTSASGYKTQITADSVQTLNPTSSQLTSISHSGVGVFDTTATDVASLTPTGIGFSLATVTLASIGIVAGNGLADVSQEYRVNGSTALDAAHCNVSTEYDIGGVKVIDANLVDVAVGYKIAGSAALTATTCNVSTTYGIGGTPALTASNCNVSTNFTVGGNQVVKTRLGALGTLAGAATLAQVITKVNLIITNALGISAGHGLTAD